MIQAFVVRARRGTIARHVSKVFALAQQSSPDFNLALIAVVPQFSYGRSLGRFTALSWPRVDLRPSFPGSRRPHEPCLQLDMIGCPVTSK